MLESVFIFIMAIGFVSFVLAIQNKSIVFSAVSLLMWIVTLAGQLYIEVPSDTNYSEPALFAVALGFIIINVIWMVVHMMDFKNENDIRPPHLR